MQADSLSAENPVLKLDLGLDGWQLVTDKVMGGVSTANALRTTHAGKHCLHLQGEVSTDNNGGFVQIAKDLPGELATKAGTCHGLRLQVYGNGERYNLHIRTRKLVLPWQSYRATFQADPQWSTIDIPFQRFTAYKTPDAFDVHEIRRIGIVAIGRDFSAAVYIAAIGFYFQPLLR